MKKQGEIAIGMPFSEMSMKFAFDWLTHRLREVAACTAILALSACDGIAKREFDAYCLTKQAVMPDKKLPIRVIELEGSVYPSGLGMLGAPRYVNVQFYPGKIRPVLNHARSVKIVSQAVRDEYVDRLGIERSNSYELYTSPTLHPDCRLYQQFWYTLSLYFSGEAVEFPERAPCYAMRKAPARVADARIIHTETLGEKKILGRPVRELTIDIVEKGGGGLFSRQIELVMDGRVLHFFYHPVLFSTSDNYKCSTYKSEQLINMPEWYDSIFEYSGNSETSSDKP